MSKKKEPHQYNCLICGDECVTRDKRSKICKKRKCVNEYGRLNYQNKTYKLECSKCGDEFDGKYRELNCPSCKELPIILNLETIKRNILCKKCPTIMGEEVVKVNHQTVVGDIHGDVCCKECLKISREQQSESKKGENNPNWVGGPEFHKRKNKTRSKEEQRQLASERMKLNNPMKNPEVAAKVSEIVKERIHEERAKGNIIYKHGKDNHLWKGNRKRAQTIRSRLYKVWIYPILEKQGFKCQDCGKTKCRLEVHHNQEPFREILAKFLNSKNLEELSYEEFEIVSQKVIDYHIQNNVEGITYCKGCHKKHDKLRK